jgi:pyruvate/2-oxoglutarate dehydrogenase complex dihydrolipoamide dehydrogenase (E3) component
MQGSYDIIVIGAGSAGLSVSLFMGKTGLRTLLIDKAERSLGGDCLNYGCIPSKALIHISKVIHQARVAAEFGLTVSGKPDALKVMEYIRQRQDIVRGHENSAFLKKSGIEVVLGEATFHSTNSIKVNNLIYRGKKIVIATGSRPRIPEVKGIELVKIYTNESVFDIQQLPSKMLVLGGGPIGIEMAQALNRLACEVTVIHKHETILPADPSATTDILLKELQKERIVFYLNSNVTEFTSSTSCKVKQNGNNEIQLSFDAVFVAAGRTMNVENLNPDSAGVQVENGKIKSNDYLRTTNKKIFVCGDIAGKLKFSHEAERHARILINNFFSPLKKKLKDNHKSWVTFSDPQLATFGLGENELQKRNLDFETITLDFNEDDRAVTDNYRYGKLILFAGKKSILGKQKVLGGSMVAPNAGEMIQELLLLMETGLSIDLLFEKIYPYPVSSRVNQLAIVKHKEKVLTPGILKLLRFLYKWS